MHSTSLLGCSRTQSFAWRTSAFSSTIKRSLLFPFSLCDDQQRRRQSYLRAPFNFPKRDRLPYVLAMRKYRPFDLAACEAPG